MRRVAVFFLLALGPAWADVVHLKDGRKLEGIVTDLGERLKIERRYGSVLVNKAEVLRIETKEFTEAPAPPPPAAAPRPDRLPESSPSPLAKKRPRPGLRLLNSYTSLAGNFVLYHPAAWTWAAPDGLERREGGLRLSTSVSESTAEFSDAVSTAGNAVLLDAPGTKLIGWEYFQASGRPAALLEFESLAEGSGRRTLLQVVRSERTLVVLRFAEDAAVFDQHWYEAYRILRSIRFFQRAELSPLQKDVFVAAWKRGHGALQEGSGDVAVRAFRDCLEILPDFAVGQGALARAYLLKKEYRSAVVALQLGLRAEPDNVLLNWILALTYVLWGKEDDAAQALRKTMAVDPENDEAFFYAGVLFAGKDRWADAKDAWKKGVEANPDSGRLHYALGFAYEKLGKSRDAAECYKKCLEVDPGVADAKARLGALKK